MSAVSSAGSSAASTRQRRGSSQRGEARCNAPEARLAACWPASRAPARSGRCGRAPLAAARCPPFQARCPRRHRRGRRRRRREARCTARRASRAARQPAPTSVATTTVCAGASRSPSQPLAAPRGGAMSAVSSAVKLRGAGEVAGDRPSRAQPGARCAGGPCLTRATSFGLCDHHGVCAERRPAHALKRRTSQQRERWCDVRRFKAPEMSRARAGNVRRPQRSPRRACASASPCPSSRAMSAVSSAGELGGDHEAAGARSARAKTSAERARRAARRPGSVGADKPGAR